MNVAKENKGSGLLVRLVGSIEESVSFDQVIGPPPAELEVNCKEVPRINSLGVKAWIKYFQECKNKGTRLKFVECSTAIVEQFNLISNFSSGGMIESIYLPFSCGSCASEFVGLFKCEDLKKANFAIPEVKCPKCSNAAEFDDIPEEYFRFMER